MKKTIFDIALFSAKENFQAINQFISTLPSEKQGELSPYINGLIRALEDLGHDEQHLYLFENKHTVMFLIDPKTGKILDANPAAELFYGYDRAKLLEMNISDINILNDSEVKMEMERARSEERNYFNFRHRLSNGEVRDVEVYSDPVNINGNDCLFSVIHDITRRKQVESTLDNERRLLRTLIDNIPDQIYAHDRDCRFILNNLADSKIMGVNDPATLVGKNDFDFYLPELAAKYQADDKLVMETDQAINIPSELNITADSKQLLVNTIKVPLHDSEGSVIGLVGISHDMTDRIQMERSLRESEEKYRELFEDAIEGIVQSLPDGRILRANRSYARIFGYDTAEEMILALPDVSKVYTNPEDRVRLIRLLDNSNRVEGFEAEGICKDGTLIWCSINVNAIRGPNNEILRLDSRLMNITERKLAEFALQQKTEELDRFFNLSLDLLCIADTDGFFRRLNKAWEDTLGFTIDELIGKSYVDLVYPDDVKSTLAAMSELSNQKPVINFVNRYRCKDGTYKWIEWRSVPVGNLIYGAARDITEHKLSEENLFESRRMLQLVLDNIPQRVFWKDVNLNFLGCNRWMAMDAGINSTTEIVGKSDFDLNWKDRATLYRSDDQWVMDNDSPKLNFEEPLSQPDGSQNWVHTNKIPLHDRDGKVIGILGTYEDITNRKKDEAQVKLTNEKLIEMVSTLEKRNREANMLREMDDLLQVCNTPEEAYSVIQQYCKLLFPSSSGGLFLFNKSRRIVEASAIWGENLQSELVFSLEDCWTLRRVQVQQWNSLTSNLRCKHMPASFNGEYLGIPMLAAGELMGMLHIENQEPGWQKKDIEELVLILSEHLALSLSNINLREKLRAQSIRDPLTGLFNRRYMEETLEREILRANRSKTSIGIIMLDIDHFKNFNDTFGHEAGDAILNALGLLLQGQVRGDDIACRFGGEEFILILPGASLEVTHVRAEQIRLAVKDMSIEYDHQSVGNITASLGIAGYSIHGKNSEELLQLVDKGLYKAKHLGRDRVEMVDIKQAGNIGEVG